MGPREQSSLENAAEIIDAMRREGHIEAASSYLAWALIEMPRRVGEVLDSRGALRLRTTRIPATRCPLSHDMAQQPGGADAMGSTADRPTGLSGASIRRCITTACR